MKIEKEKIILNLSLFISLILGTFFWKYIKFEFSDPGINGIYSDNKYNALNDVARYICFVFLPVLTYLLNKFFFEENFFSKINYFFSTKQNNTSKSNTTLGVYLFIIILIILFEFLSINFPEHLIDTYHDGQRLSSAYKSLLDGSLWSGSYITVGIFYETLSSKLIWQLFDHVSIGLARYTEVFYILILKITLVILSYLITKQTSLKPISANLFFTINSLLLISLSDYNTASVDLITFREVPIIILTLLFILANFKNDNIFILALISIMSLFSMFWGIDRGLICNFLILLIIINFYLQKDFKKIFYIINFIFIFWVLFYLSSEKEFFYFLENTFFVLKDFSYTYGIIHPIPFSDEINSSRATKTLVLIVLSLIFSLSLIFTDEKKVPLKLKRYLLFLSIIGFLSYLYSLGRSDGPHIKQIFGFQVIFFSFFIFKLLFNKFLCNETRFSKFFIILPIVMIIFISLNTIKLNNLLSFKERFTGYIYLPDSFFLTKKDNLIIDELKSLKSLDNCIDLFTYDASILYLLRQKSCTKYYFINSLGSEKNQKEFIKEIKIKTKYIITNGNTDYWDPIDKKYGIVNDFILDNFYLYKDVNYKVMKINQN